MSELVQNQGELRSPHPTTTIERAALIQRTAEHLGIQEVFVEKDFWVTELLRAVSEPIQMQDKNDNDCLAMPIFKGGTSLSRVYKLTHRFSEDVDILIDFPENTSKGSRDKVLKKMGSTAREHLQITEENIEVTEQSVGKTRNINFKYPRAHFSDSASEHLRLELGSRGGPNPHNKYEVRSMVAEYAIDVLSEDPQLWQEFAPVEVLVLEPVRTLLEKLSLLHTAASQDYSNAESVSRLYKIGRHYYDIYCLLRAPSVIKDLGKLGRNGVLEMAQDIDEHSDGNWPYESRPNTGFSTSPAFNLSDTARRPIAVSYENAMKMVYRETDQISLDECIQMVHDNALLL